jgi:tetratricopeptide (TPR) repeat protein/tRNA A-37 threonylcarbamoyl transferase component Bud32
VTSPPESVHPSVHHESVDETLVSLGTGADTREPLPLERGDVVGRYVVLEEIGRGAMGVVFAAYDPELDRKIALKLMAVGSRREGSSVRLLREAQAMARLSHPNVITVHDVGTADGDVFIAMEWIEGGSLRSYLAASQRRWDEIVRRFIEAGEGLAAAHRQGIVHRDFKPDNVLVRADGRACVGDFGLARRDEVSTSGTSSTPSLFDDMRSTLQGRAAAAACMTATGASMGTPAYMAPEQHLRANVDARSDQFSFCVALWEALCGARPFAGTTIGAIALSVTSDKREPFPRDSPVPSKIRAALERGLSTLPERRFEHMDELLVQLRAGLPDALGHRSRGAWLGLAVFGVAGVGLLAAALVGVFSPETPPDPGPAPCSRAAEQLDGIWDAERRNTAAQTFARSKRNHAPRSFERIALRLDSVREDWIRSHTQACEATRVYGEQSEELLDRRMSCLAERRNELAAVSAALVAGGDETIDGVDGLLSVIAPISSCDDVPQLERGLAAPPIEIREPVEQLRAELATLEVQRRSVADMDLLEHATKLTAHAEALAHKPVLVEALHQQAMLLDGAGQFEQALPVARRAVALATACEHRRELAEVLTLIAWIEGNSRANTELGLWLLDIAAGESALLGDPVLLAVRITADRGAMLTVEGDYPGALAQFERALALVERELGPDHVRAADLRFNIAATQHGLGDYEFAERGFRVALDVYTELMGPDHPEVAQCHNNYAATLAALGRAKEAEQHARRAIEIWTDIGDRGNLANAYAILGNAASVREDFEASLALAKQAYEMRLEVYGAAHPLTSSALTSMAENELALGRREQALAYYHAALEGLLASVGPEHPITVGLQQALAQLESH